MPDQTLLAMIDAFNRGLHDKSIRTWRCSMCANGRVDRGVNEHTYASPNSAGPSPFNDKKDRPRNVPRCLKEKRRVGRRVHGWHEHVPVRRKRPEAWPIIDVTPAVWPPVRRKKTTTLQLQEMEVTDRDPHYSGVNYTAERGADKIHDDTQRLKEGPAHFSKPRAARTSSSEQILAKPRDTHFSNSTLSAKPALTVGAKSPLSISSNDLNRRSAHIIDHPHISPPSQTVPTTNRGPAASPDAPPTPTPCTPCKTPLIDLQKVLKRKRSQLQQSDSTTATLVRTTSASSKLSRSNLLDGKVSKESSRSGEASAKRRRVDLGDEGVERTSAVGRTNGARRAGSEEIKRDEIRKEVWPPAVLNYRERQNGDDNPRPNRPSTSRLPIIGDTYKTPVPRSDGAISHSTASQRASGESVVTSKPTRVHSPQNPAHPPVAEPTPSPSSDARKSPSTTHASNAQLFPVPARDAPDFPTSLPTPRSLSPARPTINSALDDVIERLGLHNGRSDKTSVRAPSLRDAKTRAPRLARWFAKVAVAAATTSGTSVRKRKGMAKAEGPVVGSDEGWTFIGAWAKAAG